MYNEINQHLVWQLTSAVALNVGNNLGIVDRQLVLFEHPVDERNVDALQLGVQTLHGKVTRPIVHLVIVEHEHHVLPPLKVLADPQGELPELLVGGACVGDGRVDSAVKGNGRGARRNHRNVPMGGEEANGGRCVGAAGPDESPRVVRKFKVHSHERGDGLGADAVFVFAVFEDVGEVVVREQGGVIVDGFNGSLQGGPDARPSPRVIRVALG